MESESRFAAEASGPKDRWRNLACGRPSGRVQPGRALPRANLEDCQAVVATVRGVEEATVWQDRDPAAVFGPLNPAGKVVSSERLQVPRPASNRKAVTVERSSLIA